jgi:hypothetical protein
MILFIPNIFYFPGASPIFPLPVLSFDILDFVHRFYACFSHHWPSLGISCTCVRRAILYLVFLSFSGTGIRQKHQQKMLFNLWVHFILIETFVGLWFGASFSFA